MKTYNIPRVQVREIDNSQEPAIPSFKNLVASGYAKKGIPNMVYGVLGEIASFDSFVKTFGTRFTSSTITDEVYEHNLPHYCVEEGLKSAEALLFTRVTDGTEKFAGGYIDADNGSNASAIASVPIDAFSTVDLVDTEGRIKGNAFDRIYDIDSQVDFVTNTGSSFYLGSKSPGIYGNDIAIEIVTHQSTDNFDWGFAFDEMPTTHDQSALNNSSELVVATYVNEGWSVGDQEFTIPSDAKFDKVFKIRVFIKDPKKTAFVEGDLVEEFLVSKRKDIFLDGNSVYIQDVINKLSSYIYVVDNTADTDAMLPSGVNKLALSGGVDTSLASIVYTNISKSYGFFEDKNKLAISLLVNPYGSDAVKTAIDNLANAREDFLSVNHVGEIPTSGTIESVNDVMINIVSKKKTGLTAPSYFSEVAGWYKLFDAQLGTEVLIPNVAQQCRIILGLALPHLVPAGTGFGTGKAVLSGNQAFDFDEAMLEALSNNHINAPLFIQGTGSVLWLQYTSQMVPSATDRINVRTNVNDMKKNVKVILFDYIHELDLEENRSSAKRKLDRYFESKLSDGAIVPYKEFPGYETVVNQGQQKNSWAVKIKTLPTESVEVVDVAFEVTSRGVIDSEE